MTNAVTNDSVTHDLPTIAVLGGTGKEGSGLAIRWALHGYPVILGSRDGARAAEKAAEFTTAHGIASGKMTGLENLAAAQAASIVVLSVPYDAHAATLEYVRSALDNKILIDVAVPLQPPKIRTVYIPEGKSAALEAQALLSGSTRVVAAYHNVSAVHLQDPEGAIACDVLITGDDVDAKAQTIQLTHAIGLRGLDAGPLANAVAVEAMTPVLLYLNKQYKVKSTGIVITGLPDNVV